MRHTTKIIALGALVITTFLSGCSTETGGVGGSAGQPDSSGSSSATNASQAAPKVQNPLDAKKFQSAPCSVLTSGQLHTLGITDPGKPGAAPGPLCEWQDKTSAKHLQVSVTAIAGSGGLSAIYQQNSNHDLALFQPVPDIDGYPAVIYDGGSGNERTLGSCHMSVGVTDQMVYAIGTSVSDKSDPCTTAQNIAQMVVQTLKGGS